MKKVLAVGVYDSKLIYTASPYPGDNVFARGFEKNGYEVVRFDYRAISQPNENLLKIAKESNFDIFYFGKAEKIFPETIKELREKNKNSIFIKFGADVRDEPTKHDMEHNQHIDWFFGTYGGEYLKKHLLPEMKGVSSIIAFTDSDFYKHIEEINIPTMWKTDILWTGRRSIGNNELRNQTIDRLLQYENAKVYGLSEWLGDPEYLYAINGTKIGVGVNSYKHTTKWTSDRLGNYMACGTFYLCHDFGGIDEVFKRGHHLDWFRDIEEMNEKIKYYLKHDDIRKRIAKNGREFVLKYFDTKPLVANLLSIIKTKKSNYFWDDVYVN